jgi:hypothetical protein
MRRFWLVLNLQTRHGPWTIKLFSRIMPNSVPNLVLRMCFLNLFTVWLVLARRNGR